MRGLGELTRAQARLFLREPGAFFFTLVFPSLLLVVFGLIFGNEPMTHWGMDVGYIDLQVPALAAIILGSVGLMGIPIATATAREMRVLRRLRATPVSPLTLISADVLVNFAMSLAGMAVLVAMGKLLFGLRFGGSWLLVIAAFAYSACAFFALGYLVASLAPTARAAQAAGMALFFPLMFLSGAAIPRQIMPDGEAIHHASAAKIVKRQALALGADAVGIGNIDRWEGAPLQMDPRQIMPENVRRAADYLPLTHVVELLQTAWQGQALSSRLPEALWLAAILVLATLISARLFRWE